MTTQVFFISRSSAVPDGAGTGTNNVMLGGSTSGWAEGSLSTSRGSGLTNNTVTTVLGPTSGLEVTDTVSSLPREWISAPVDQDFTLSGTVTFNLWMGESATTANAGAQCVIERLDSTGALISTVVNSEKGTELPKTSSIAAQNWTASPTSTAFKKGDLIRIRVAANDAGGTMASGLTVTFDYNGTTAAADGDSYVTFTETFGFLRADPTTATIYPTTTVSEIAPGGAGTDTKEAWTSRGSGTTNAVRNTATGWTAPLQQTVTGGGNLVEWFTRPLAAFTLAAPVLVNFRGKVDLTGQHISFRAEIAVTDNDGTNPVVWGATTRSPLGSGDFGTSDSAVQIYVAGANTAITDGQRLRLRFYADDFSDLPMVTGHSLTASYAGTSAAAVGDAYFVFGQSLTQLAFRVIDNVFINPTGSEDVADLFPDRTDYSCELAANDVMLANDAVTAVQNAPAVPITDEFIPTLHPSAQGSEDVAALFPDRTDYVYENAAGDLLNTDVTATFAPNESVSTNFDSGVPGSAVSSFFAALSGTVLYDNDVRVGTASIRFYGPETAGAFGYFGVGQHNRWYTRMDFAVSTYPTSPASVVTWGGGQDVDAPPAVGIDTQGRLVLFDTLDNVADVTGTVVIPRDTFVRLEVVYERRTPISFFVSASLFLDPTGGAADDTISGTLTVADPKRDANGLCYGNSGTDGAAWSNGVFWFDDIAASTLSMPAPTGTAQAAGARPSLIANASPLPSQDYTAALFPERTDYTWENAAGDLLNQDVSAQLSPHQTVANVDFEAGTLGSSLNVFDSTTITDILGMTFDNDVSVGSMSGRFYAPNTTDVATGYGIGLSRPHNRLFVRFDLAVSALPNQAMDLVGWQGYASGYPHPAFALGSDGVFSARSDASSANFANPPISPDTLVRIELMFERQDDTHVYITFALYLDPTSGTPDYSSNAVISTSQAVTDQTGPAFGFFRTGNAALGRVDLAAWFDDIRVSTLSMPAPTGTAQTVGARGSFIANASPFANQDTLAALFPDRVDYTYENAAGDLVNTDNVATFFSQPAPDITDEFIPTLHPSQGSEDVAALFPDRVDYTYEYQANSVTLDSSLTGLAGALIVANSERLSSSETETLGATVQSGNGDPDVWNASTAGNVIATYDNDTAVGTQSIRVYVPDTTTGAWNLRWSLQGSASTFGGATRVFLAAYVRLSQLPPSGGSLNLLRVAAVTGNVREFTVDSTGVLQIYSGSNLLVSSAALVLPDVWFRLEAMVELQSQSPQSVYHEARLYLDPTASVADADITATNSTTFDQVSGIGLGVSGNPTFTPSRSAVWFDNVRASAAGWIGWDGSTPSGDARISQIVNVSPIPSQDYAAALFPERTDYAQETNFDVATDFLLADVVSGFTPTDPMGTSGVFGV